MKNNGECNADNAMRWTLPGVAGTAEESKKGLDFSVTPGRRVIRCNGRAVPSRLGAMLGS
jgi:hypothetical protein